MLRSFRPSLACFALAALTACTSLADPDEEVTIQQGVYGLTISGCDVGNCDDSPYEHAPITITPSNGSAPISLESDGAGFFESSLEPGDYELCVHSCTTITIAEGARVRRDFVAGPGGGIWCVDGVCGPEQ
jgi:hypothetical protein